MLRRTFSRIMCLIVIVALSGLVMLCPAHQRENKLSASAVWTHSDGYETKLIKDGVTYACSMILKGDDVLVTIEVRTSINERATIGDTTQTLVLNGKIHKFKLNKKDGSLSDLVWMVYSETDNEQRFANRVKTGPATKLMLEPFKDVLGKLPSEIYQLFEKLLR